MDKPGKKIKPPVKKNKKNRPLSRRPNKYSPIVYYASGVLGNDLCPICGGKIYDQPCIESREELTSGVVVTLLVSDGEPQCPECGWTHSQGVPVPVVHNIPEYDGRVPF